MAYKQYRNEDTIKSKRKKWCFSRQGRVSPDSSISLDDSDSFTKPHVLLDPLPTHLREELEKAGKVRHPKDGTKNGDVVPIRDIILDPDAEVRKRIKDVWLFFLLQKNFEKKSRQMTATFKVDQK